MEDNMKKFLITLIFFIFCFNVNAKNNDILLDISFANNLYLTYKDVYICTKQGLSIPNTGHEWNPVARIFTERNAYNALFLSAAGMQLIGYKTFENNIILRKIMVATIGVCEVFAIRSWWGRHNAKFQIYFKL
jgi:hypothetical protein